jgi:hypothetical protein
MLPLTSVLAVAFAGEPQFPTRTFELAGHALRCDVVDVDHDGAPDLLAEQAGRFRWLKGDGTGQLEAQGIVPGSEGWKRRELADADGDGWLDALATMSGPERLVFVAGDGHGGFAPPQGIDLGTFPLARCADLDHDGDLDCVAWESTTRTLRSYRRTGTSFVPAGSIALPGAHVAALALGDLDGDHEVDVAFSAYRVTPNLTFSLGVLHGTGQGTFGDRRILAGIQASQLEFCDLDRDGRGELLVGNGQARALRHQFARSYSLSWLCDFGYGRIRLADSDGDGDLDLLGGSNLGSVVHLNDGFGRFPGRRVLWTHELSAAAAFADLDGDGSADVAGPIQGASLAVTLASSLPPQDAFVGRTGNTWPVDAGDIDGDGDLDLLLQRDGILEFAHGDGAGGLQPAGQLVLDPLAVFPFLTTWAERLTDLDGDGDLDLVGRRSSGIRFTQLNQGDGSFDPPADLIIATHTEPSWADFDGDGLVDLLACAPRSPRRASRACGRRIREPGQHARAADLPARPRRRLRLRRIFRPCAPQLLRSSRTSTTASRRSRTAASSACSRSRAPSTSAT